MRASDLIRLDGPFQVAQKLEVPRKVVVGCSKMHSVVFPGHFERPVPVSAGLQKAVGQVPPLAGDVELVGVLHVSQMERDSRDLGVRLLEEDTWQWRGVRERRGDCGTAAVNLENFDLARCSAFKRRGRKTYDRSCGSKQP
jgi:hypothetical protein